MCASLNEESPTLSDRNVTAAMVRDIIASVLKRPEDISEVTSGLAGKIRALTGANAVILVVVDDHGDRQTGYRTLAVSPIRHENITETESVRKLIEASFLTEQATVVPLNEKTDAESILPDDRNQGFCLIIPLKNGEERVGSILALGPIDESRILPVLEIHSVLQGVVSVVLKNAMLTERQQLMEEELERKIAEHRQTEAVLQENEEIFGAFMEHSPVYVFFKDENIRAIRLSKNYSKMLGKPVKDLLGKDMGDLFPAELAQSMIADDKKILHGGKEVVVDEELAGRFYTTIKFPIHIKGKPRYLAGFTLDITERKKAEETLKSYSHHLQERVKELNCLYEISEIVQREDISEAVMFKECAAALVRAYQYPEVAVCCITWGNEEYGTEYFQRTPWLQERAIMVHDKWTGKIEVCYREERRHEYDGPFLAEECNLISSVANLLGRSTERKQAEQQTRCLLAEKEILLKEVHHRIKNNMNTMMDLLSFQADIQEDPSASRALRDAENRLYSMSVLYDELYRSEDFQEMSANDYLVPLVEKIVEIFPGRIPIKTEMTVGTFMLPVKILATTGIIVNELITNIMKYAFADREDGVITVSATKKDNRVVLVIADNGIGMEGQVDLKRGGGFGMRLVSMLVEQVEGKMTIEGGAGTRFILEFPV